MALRDEIEKQLAELRRRTEEAEAEATQAGEQLVRLVSMTSLDEVDEAGIYAASDTFADAVGKRKLLQEFARTLRALLM